MVRVRIEARRGETPWRFDAQHESRAEGHAQSSIPFQPTQRVTTMFRLRNQSNGMGASAPIRYFRPLPPLPGHNSAPTWLPPFSAGGLMLAR